MAMGTRKSSRMRERIPRKFHRLKHCRLLRRRKVSWLRKPVIMWEKKVERRAMLQSRHNQW